MAPGPSIWQRFCHTPDMVRDGDTGDVACDHYRRYRDDVALMRELGSTPIGSASRGVACCPSGRGHGQRGGPRIFTNGWSTRCLQQGIEPMVTLFHWDLPAALDDRGGWLNPDIAGWFADYATVVFRRLDGRVKLWATLNEPWVVTDGGYLHGALAPGHRNRFEAPIAAHQLMRAHGAAVKAYRAKASIASASSSISSPSMRPPGDADDRAATARADAYMNRQFLDPMLLGTYPEELAEIFGEAWPRWPAGRSRADQTADRLRRRQLLHAQRHALRSRRVAAARRAGPPEAGHLHRNRTGRSFRRD